MSRINHGGTYEELWGKRVHQLFIKKLASLGLGLMLQFELRPEV